APTIIATLLSVKRRGLSLWVEIITITSIIFGLFWGLPTFYLETDDFFRSIWGANFIFSILGTISMPIINYLFTSKSPNDLTRTLLITCPRCFKSQEMPLGKSYCRQCKLTFNLIVEEPRCPKCDYILHGLTQPRCPECGEIFSSEELVANSTPISSPIAVNPPAPPANPANS
ncbi:MAG TPA: hypothetical protein VHP11_03885, partial [Tepidisphaeraceae bacterium]|nr:hypothetical protein [Tepidisphaeraceae bacterium]